jgi:Flp pilus assembly protein TadD
MGYVCLIAGEYQEAVHWCSRALEYDKHDVYSLANLGASLSGVGKHEEARTVLQQALEISPNHPPALYSMGTLLLFTGFLSEALKYLEKAVAFNPNYTEAWNHLGIALLISGQPGSRECFENALRANVTNQSAVMNLAMAIQCETSCSTNDAVKKQSILSIEFDSKSIT